MPLLLLLSITAATFVLVGPLWAAVAFLGVAVVRIALLTSALQAENEALRMRLSQSELGADSGVGDAPPRSGTRHRARSLPGREASGA